ncbi:MAG: molybdopterin-dependent oxidoreductase [Desulfosarcinaceae bacterium]|nr:molybdopterin-dependent oxidoreductase [Desulfosarcinaceae bacterium]
MLNRRQLLQRLLQMASGILPLSGIRLLHPSTLWAAVKKRIVSATTDPQTLRNANPKYLDTRQLPVMPLEAFGTMGDEKTKFDPQNWRLTIDGAVERPQSLSYAGLLKRPEIIRNVLLICPGVFVNHGRWHGVSLGDLLKRSVPAKTAKWVVIHAESATQVSEERFAIEEVTADLVFLATGVNGQPLPEKHGYPLRVVAEGHYGYTWAKYVRRIEVR